MENNSALDKFIKENDLRLICGNLKEIEGKESLRIKNELGFEIKLPDNINYSNENFDIKLTYKNENNGICLTPKVIVLGMGCRRGKDFESLVSYYEDTLKKLNISEKSVEKICSIDLKKDEEGLIKLSQAKNIKFETYTSEELLSTQGDFSASKFVKSVTGVDNVCERSAVFGSKGGKILLHKESRDGMTIAVAERNYI